MRIFLITAYKKGVFDGCRRLRKFWETSDAEKCDGDLHLEMARRGFEIRRVRRTMGHTRLSGAILNSYPIFPIQDSTLPRESAASAP